MKTSVGIAVSAALFAVPALAQRVAAMDLTGVVEFHVEAQVSVQGPLVLDVPGVLVDIKPGAYLRGPITIRNAEGQVVLDVLPDSSIEVTKPNGSAD